MYDTWEMNNKVENNWINRHKFNIIDSKNGDEVKEMAIIESIRKYGRSQIGEGKNETFYSQSRRILFS